MVFFIVVVCHVNTGGQLKSHTGVSCQCCVRVLQNHASPHNLVDDLLYDSGIRAAESADLDGPDTVNKPDVCTLADEPHLAIDMVRGREIK